MGSKYDHFVSLRRCVFPNCDDQSEINGIIDKIKIAANSSEYSVCIYKYINEETKQQLRKSGYEVREHALYPRYYETTT